MSAVSILSLFTGIGMFDLGVSLALEEAGYDVRIAAQVEIDDFCRRVLARHFPTTHREVTDVRDVCRENTPWADIIIGGFPCQDLSSAGKRAGLFGKKSGLWWEFWRIVREMRPRVVLIENVASGLRDWHGTVRCSLEGLGYHTRARKISAADIGAPHRRERVFVLAYASGERRERPWLDREAGGWRAPSDGGCLADANRGGQQCCAKFDGKEEKDSADRDTRRRHVDGLGGPDGVGDTERERWSWETWGEVPNEAPRLSAGPSGLNAQSRLGGATAGRPGGMDARWPAGRGEEQYPWEAPRTVGRGMPYRRKRLKALGNCVTWQQAREATRFSIDVLGW